MSEELEVELSNHCFASNVKLFKQDSIKLKHKNFIFAKNGSGKSTFAELVKHQFEITHNVQLFQGLGKYFGENSRLNAFALAVNAGENESLISKKEFERSKQEELLNDIKNQLRMPDNTDEVNVYKKLYDSKNTMQLAQKEISDFYTQSAAKIKNKTNPQISKTTYSKKDFESEKLKAKELTETEIDDLKEILKSDLKIAKIINYKSFDLSECLNITNDLLVNKVEERTRIVRLNTQDKINFAETGLQIHNHKEGEICSFCGNPISQDTFTELESYFSADEVKKFNGKISNQLKIFDQQIALLNEINFSDNGLYPIFKQQAKKEFDKINQSKIKVQEFFKQIKESLLEKKHSLFEELSEVNIEIPENIEFSAFNELMDQNNRYGEDLSQRKEEAKDSLRYHEIKMALDSFQFDLKKEKLRNYENLVESAQKDFDAKNQKKQIYEKSVNQLSQEIEMLKPKAEEIAVKHINQKLNSTVSWYVDYKEDEKSGYYQIAEKNNDGAVFYRGVSELSTGEKNIIAFLYFIEKLEEITDTTQLPKIIIFDDPMNSNDDIMQYLIITELQKIYQGKFLSKYDPNKDYFILMTHNVHFYLNVPPHGAFKDTKGKTKYDKNIFYRLHKGSFQQITSEKDDFKTNYDAIWSELSELAELNLRNSMLNSMRRIIETYLDFTNIKQDAFYQDNEQYLKLFNVNSHGAIDSTSSEAFTATADELIRLFYSIFRDNNSTDHFDAHWKGKTISL